MCVGLERFHCRVSSSCPSPCLARNIVPSTPYLIVQNRFAGDKKSAVSLPRQHWFNRSTLSRSRAFMTSSSSSPSSISSTENYSDSSPSPSSQYCHFSESEQYVPSHRQHVLTISDLDHEELHNVIDNAIRMKTNPNIRDSKCLEGYSMVILNGFEQVICVCVRVCVLMCMCVCVCVCVRLRIYRCRYPLKWQWNRLAVTP